jgi:hypothetical protein
MIMVDFGLKRNLIWKITFNKILETVWQIYKKLKNNLSAPLWNEIS